VWPTLYNYKKFKIYGFLLTVLLGWYVFENLSVSPYYLTYFNQAVGGPSGGYRYVVDSNLDWGQDLKRFSNWVKENDIAYLEAEPNLLAKIAINILGIVWYIKILLLLISVIFIFCIIYLFRKVMSLSIVEARKLYPESYFNGTSLDLSVASAQINPKWQKIQDHVESINENNWKLAIIEADIMLGEVLDNLSLPGETIGDKLKAVERSDFTTVDLAWEAHKIRNQIAHEGSSFLLNQRETKRILSLYQAVFEEFHII